VTDVDDAALEQGRRMPAGNQPPAASRLVPQSCKSI